MNNIDRHITKMGFLQNSSSRYNNANRRNARRNLIVVTIVTVIIRGSEVTLTLRSHSCFNRNTGSSSNRSCTSNITQGSCAACSLQEFLFTNIASWGMDNFGTSWSNVSEF